MTREEEWDDPEIQALLADVKDSIDRFLHRKKTSRPVASLSAKRVCNVSKGGQPDAFTGTPPETTDRDKLSKLGEQPAA